MKAKSILIGLIAIFLLGTSQIALAEKEERNVDNFTKVAFSVSGEVYITIGKKYEVILEGDKDLLKILETNIDGDLLKIKRKRGHRSNKKVIVYITMPELNSVIVSGSGKVITKNIVNVDKFKAVLSGSGKILVDDLIAKDTYATISGSGDIQFIGKAETSSMVISGSGDIEAENLETEKAKVVISGSGSVKVYAKEDLKVTISGSGSVYFKGDPHINSTSVGSGRLKSL